MKQRFTEEQIVKILKEAETRRQKYGGLETSDVRRLKDLERENGELKKVVAKLTLDNRMLKDVNAKKW